MKTLLLSLLTFFSTYSCYASYDFSKNPIYHAIKILHKDINSEEAIKYSNIIAKYSKQYSIDPFLVVSISRQESYLTLEAVRKIGDSKITYDSKTKKFLKTVEITDFCMMQINKSNIIWKNLDPNRLLSDADYCIHEGFKVLVYFKNLEKNDEFWWTRYNASKSDAREIYKNYVLKHYNRLVSELPNMQLVRNEYTSSSFSIAMEEN